MPEPSAWLLIINCERNRFQENIALKKKKKRPLLTPGQPSVVSSSGAKLWEEGEGAAGSSTTSRGGSQVFFVLPLWTGHCRERKEHLLALSSLGYGV